MKPQSFPLKLDKIDMLTSVMAYHASCKQQDTSHDIEARVRILHHLGRQRGQISWVCPRGGGGGVLKLRFDRYIMLLIVMPEIALRKSYDHTHGLNHIFFSGYFFYLFFFFLLTISILPLQYVQIILTIH